VLKKLQRGLKAMEGWCEKWKKKLMRTRLKPSASPKDSDLMLKGRAITFVDTVKYLGVTFDKKITWKTHIDWIVTKGWRTFIQIYSLLKRDKLSIKAKMTLYEALIRSKMTYACPAWESAAETSKAAKQSPPSDWWPAEAHTYPEYACGAPNSVCI
jgi:hypothetical protein